MPIKNGKRHLIPTTPGGRIGISILCIAILCTVFAIVSRHSASTASKADEAKRIRTDRSSIKQDPSDSIFERILRAAGSGSHPETVKNYVDQQFIHSPLSLIGVNKTAKSYFNLTDSQCEKIKEIALKTQEKIVTNIVSNIIVDKNSAGEIIAISYVGNPEISKTIKEEFKSQLEAAGSSDFAAAAQSALIEDPLFLSVGEHTINFNSVEDPSRGNLIRLEMKDDKGNFLEATIVSEEELNDNYHINLGAILSGGK